MMACHAGEDEDEISPGVLPVPAREILDRFFDDLMSERTGKPHPGSLGHGPCKHQGTGLEIDSQKRTEDFGSIRPPHEKGEGYSHILEVTVTHMEVLLVNLDRRAVVDGPYHVPLR